jgi:outer membrane protein assembly factor BamB
MKKGCLHFMRFQTLMPVVLALVLYRPAYALDTSMFRANPQHTGVYESRAVTHFGRVKWKFHTGGYVISSPAVADGIVYIGSSDGFLYALDSGAGTLRWKFATHSRVVSSPAVSAGIVYFSSYDGNFYAVDAKIGRLKWKFRTAGEKRFEGTHLHGSLPAAEIMPDPFDVYLSSPVIWGGKVFFGSGDGNIYALDATSGELDWKFKTGDVVHASPAIADGMLFIGSWDSYFYALDTATGEQRWRFKTGDDPDIHNQVGIQSSAAVLDGMVYFGCRDSHLYALDEHTGRKVWAFPTHGAWVVTSPAVNDGTVYFATSDSGLFYGLGARNGSIIFSLKFNGWPTFSSPAVAGNMVYVGSSAGKLTAIDLGQKKVSWTFRTDGAKQNTSLYTKADGSPNYEVAFKSDFYDDMVIGASKMKAIGSIFSSPVITNGVLYVGSTDGNLYALI